MLASFGADYAALGHIHNADNYRGEAGSCSYAYCGCLVGRSFDECGDKGALVVTVDKDSDSAKAAVRTMKFSRRRYEDISVDVTGAATSREVTDKIEDAISGADDETAVRVRIYGVTDSALVISPTVIAEAFPGVFSFTLKDETLPLGGADYLEDDLSVRGEFYRMIKPKLESADAREREVALRALRYVTAAIGGENISDI